MIFPLQALLQLVLQEFQQGLGWVTLARFGREWVGLGGLEVDGWDWEGSGWMGGIGKIQGRGWVGLGGFSVDGWDEDREGQGWMGGISPR